uniref:Doublecortin domain-containing protein n=1 Tax=Trichuris muris TaxID=70415 RepID=A0A5S6QBU6_TRIMR
MALELSENVLRYDINDLKRLVSVAVGQFRSFDALLEDLNRVLGDLVNLPHGVRYVFSLDGQKRIQQLSELDDGESYVCSSNESFKKIDYQNVREPVWSYGFRSNCRVACSTTVGD